MGIKIITKNRKAFFQYNIEDKIEVGVVLKGSEVKSLRDGHANLSDAYALIEGGELYLINSHINPYDNAATFNHEPKRKRKLLAHKNEIIRLHSKLQRKGYTLVPLSMYFKEGKVKVEIALAVGKKLFDKRESIKKREDKRTMDRMKRGR